MKQSVICEMYGESINNKFIEYIMIFRRLDFAVCDMAEELEISKPKAYQVIREFEEKGYIIKSRVIGKTQLYKVNKENRNIKILIKQFKESLKLIMEEYAEKEKKKKSKSRQY